MIVHDNRPGHLPDGRTLGRLNHRIRREGEAAMGSSLPRARQAMGWVAVACAAVLAAACGSIPAPGTGSTATAPAGSTATTTGPAPQPGTSSAGTTAPAAQGGPCSTAALRVTLGSQQGAAAGHFYRTLDFTNISGASCTLYGYPGVSFVTAPGGGQIGPAATRNPAAAKQLVTVPPGQTVHAELQVVDAENYPPADCGLVTAHWLKIYPPNQTAPAYVGFTAQACSKPKQILSVQTVQPGSAGT